MARTIEGTVESSIGFYIGDICYVLSDVEYHDFWGVQKGYDDGVYETPSGLKFAVARTAYGDGLYHDDNGNEYPVDAGVIGVVPHELIGKGHAQLEKWELGVMLTGTRAEFKAEDGYFEVEIYDRFGKLIHTVCINTKDEEVDE